MKQNQPTIKGIFVNSHVKALVQARGEVAFHQLEELYGASPRFTAMQDVPVRDEVKIIELCLQIMHPEIPPSERAYHAGRLHFTNFSQTPLGRIIFTTLPRDFKTMMMRSSYIAQHVFKHVSFTPTELGPKHVQVIMKNNDYPIDHFRGLFQAWMDFYEEHGTVTGETVESGTYVYNMVWE